MFLPEHTRIHAQTDGHAENTMPPVPSIGWADIKKISIAHRQAQVSADRLCRRRTGVSLSIGEAKY